jgi:hypothetical protein
MAISITTTLPTTTLSIKGYVTLNLTTLCHYAECDNAERYISFITLNIITASVVMLFAVTLNVIAQHFKSSSIDKNISANVIANCEGFYFKSFLPASSRNGGASATVNFKNHLCCKILGQ